MTLIKPFKILQTREEPEGTGVVCEISKSVAKENTLEVHSIETYVLVPKGQEIDTYLLAYFKEGGWL